MQSLFPRRQSPVAVVTVDATPSKEMARKRLQLVLVQDRIGLSQELLESLKNDLLDTISRYLVIERNAVDMEVSRTGDSVTLVSNIRVNDVRKTPTASH
jgi:cell division topological specificity factor